MKPKLWNGANAVGEAKARELARLDVPYLTASGPGFEAKKAGSFMSVTGTTPTLPEDPPDGWYASSDTASPPAQVVGSHSPHRRFRKRGTADSNSELVSRSLGLYASGTGWGYVHQVLKTENDWRYETVSRTKNGGKSTKALFSRWYLSAPWEGNYVGYSATNYASYLSSPALLMASATFAPNTAGMLRQRPALDLAVVSNAGTELYSLYLPEFADGADYSFAEVGRLLPHAWVLAYGKAGNEPGTLAVTYDAGNTWQQFATTALMPGYFSDPEYKSEAQISAEYPAYTPAQVQAKHMGQKGVTSRMLSAHVTLDAVSARRLLCSVKYPVSASGWQVSESVVDALTGTVLRQCTYAADQFGYILLGRDCWLRRRKADGVYTTDVTTDGGATYTTTPAPQWLGDVAAVVPKRPNDGATDTRIYFTNEGGGARTLYYTDDLFGSYEEAASVSPRGAVVGEYDYAEVRWVGSPQAPAPIDPVFPWRVDTRFAIPDWWLDGVTL